MTTLFAQIRHAGQWAVCVSAVCILAACTPDSLTSSDFPADIADPAQLRTPTGAIQAYGGVVNQLRTTFGGYGPNSFVLVSGLLADELQSANVGAFAVTVPATTLYDGRTLPEYQDPELEAVIPSNATYGSLQRTRNSAHHTIALLRAYAPDAPPAYVGHLFAIQGYMELFLADLYCSGIPLSTLDFLGDYTLSPGLSTQDVYQHAATLFDSAMTFGADSVRIRTLATVGKARALLALGRNAEAATLAATVPEGALYRVQYLSTPEGTGTNFAYTGAGNTLLGTTVADREGLVGYAYATGGDPRTPVLRRPNNAQGYAQYYPAFHSTRGDSAITLASFIEARLIQAEAAVVAEDPAWLTILNALRTDGTFTTRPNSTNPTVTDTLWNAGTGGIAGLRPLGDPGTVDARIDTVFKERAFWLMLTGHRQGDMRRLIRNYHRATTTVYPNGIYPGSLSRFGSDVTAPIPAQERVSNHKFTGCIDRNA